MHDWADIILFSLGCTLFGALLLGLLTFIVLMAAYWAPRVFGGC